MQHYSSAVVWALCASGALVCASASGVPATPAHPAAAAATLHQRTSHRLRRRLRVRGGARVHHGTYRTGGPEEQCSNGTVGLQAAHSVELVVSTWADDLSWLGKLQVPITVYVHNRSGEADHCYQHSGDALGKCERPTGMLTLSEETQEALVRSNPGRRHKINFVDIPNVGDEAFAFLTHIIKRYDDLPDAIVFLHGHEYAWHAPLNMHNILQTTCFALTPGYHNLNHGKDADARSFCTGMNDWTAEPHAREKRAIQSLLAAHWHDVFQAELGSFPQRVCSDCCAQFVVSRTNLRRHPRSFYEKLLRLVTEGKTSMEYEWRLLFVPGDALGPNGTRRLPL